MIINHSEISFLIFTFHHGAFFLIHVSLSTQECCIQLSMCFPVSSCKKQRINLSLQPKNTDTIYVNKKVIFSLIFFSQYSCAILFLWKVFKNVHLKTTECTAKMDVTTMTSQNGLINLIYKASTWPLLSLKADIMSKGFDLAEKLTWQQLVSHKVALS